jgi:hypothetical protein
MKREEFSQSEQRCSAGHCKVFLNAATSKTHPYSNGEIVEDWSDLTSGCSEWLLMRHELAA